MLRAHHDFETRSPADIKRVGAHAYARHPFTAVWTMAWCLGDPSTKQIWRPGYPDPVPLLHHIANGGPIVAHNAAFERNIWNENLVARVCPHWPRIRIEQQDCTMARAQAVHLPGKLEKLCEILKLPAQKDMDGHRLMMQMARPRAKNPDGTYTWWDDDVRRDRLDQYCLGDVDAECGADEVLPFLSPRERRVWELDQHINDRGVCLNVPLVQKFERIVVAAKVTLDRQMQEQTAGAIQTCGQAAAITKWIAAQGVPCNSVAAEEHEDILLAADRAGKRAIIEPVLDLRAEAGSVSAIKFPAMLDTLAGDDRSRGLLAYHVTLQGRWAGRLWQPHNVKTREDEEITDAALAVQMAERIPSPTVLAELFDLVFDAPIGVCSLVQRSMIVAAPGYELIGGDKSNIEGRVNAWLNNEDWKIRAFHEYDAGTGPDLYRAAYAASFGVDIETVKGAFRQVGKIQELALGYQGSVSAYVKMARKKRIKLSKVRDAVKAAADATEWLLAVSAYPKARNKSGLDCETWAAVAIVVKRWRKSNSNIVQGWWDLQDAAIAAVADPGIIAYACNNRIRYLVNRGYLWCGLPSGRALAYLNPLLRETITNYLYYEDGTREDADDLSQFEIDTALANGARLVPRRKRFVTFEHENETKRWVREALYGGMQMAHVVSGIARDALVEDMFTAKDEGFNLVLTVHDELLAENRIGEKSAERLNEIMATKPWWIEGDLPLAAKCWKGPVYAK